MPNVDVSLVRVVTSGQNFCVHVLNGCKVEYRWFAVKRVLCIA